MSKKKKSRNTEDLMQPLSGLFIDKEGFLDCKDDGMSLNSENEALSMAMEQAYHSGQLSHREWKNWLETVAFCERYK